MKINKLFAACLAATVLFASCSKEESANNVPGTGEETYAGFTVSLPASAITRGVADANAATTAESAVTSIGVFVVDDATLAMHKVLLSTAGTDFAWNATNETWDAKVAVRTTTGDKKVYVVLNPTSALLTPLNASAAPFGVNVLALDESNFKTESSGVLTDIVMSGVTAVPGLTVQTSAEALANLYPVDVKRNLAKVIVRHTTATPNVVGGSHVAGTLQFGLIAKAKGAYLMEQSGVTAYTGVPTAAITDNTHAYWNNFSTTVLGSATDVYKTVNSYNTASTAYQTYAGWYCHENILATTDVNKYTGSTTAARIKGQFIPTEWVSGYVASTSAKTTANPSAAATFYRNKETMEYWSQAAYTAATANSGDNGYIQPGKFIGPYTNGWGYYQIYVMDDSRNIGVKRNSYYDLSIDQINGPGSPDEEPDPEIPIDEESHIAVTVTVMPWLRETSGHTIQ